MDRIVLSIVFCLATAPALSSATAGELHTAARNGDVAAIGRLLDQGHALEERDSTRETPLLSAALAGQRPVAEVLIDKGADIQARNDRGLTPLHAAAYAGHLDIARLLIAAGAKVDDADNEFGITPLHAAAEENQFEVVVVLLDAKAKVDVTEINGYTALSRAGFREHWDVVARLLAAGASCQPSKIVGDWLFEECTARSE